MQGFQPLLPTAQRTGYLSPPFSPEERRRRLRESDITDGEMSIETWLYNSDNYRISSLTSPLPLPLELTDPEPRLSFGDPRFALLLPKVLEILRAVSQSVPIFFTRRVSKPGYPGGDFPAAKLIVIIDQPIIDRAKWSHARDQLLNVFAAESYHEIGIEMYDENRAFLPSIFPLAPNSEAIYRYEDVRRQLVECVSEELGTRWKAMSVFDFGLSETSARPTVVVMVEPRTSLNWKGVGSRLNSILEDTNIHVEFIPGSLSMMAGKPIQKANLQRYPTMGSSIGELGEDGAGSLGGFVSLDLGHSLYRGFLTNHHVVCPLEPPPLAAFLNQYGYRDITTDPKTAIQYPAKSDLTATIEDHEKKCSDEQQQIMQIEESLERFTMQEKTPPQRLSNLHQAYKAMKEKADKITEVTDTLPFIIGDVRFSSGQSLGENKTIMDWAFVQIPSSTMWTPQNKLVGRENPVIAESRYLYPLANLTYPFEDDPPSYANGWGTIQKGEWYYKKGRTTGVTAGICHGTEVEVGRAGQVRWDENGRECVLEAGSTQELIIMSKRKTLTEGSTDSFSLPGDSGSFLVDCEGRVAGLLYGEFTGYVGPAGNQRLYINSGLVMSMDEVVKSVEKKTKGKLTLL